MKYWEKVTKDKILHAVAGLIIGFGVFYLSNAYYASFAVIVAGVGKEIYDEYIGGSGFDDMDLFATLIGGVAGIMIYGSFA